MDVYQKALVFHKRHQGKLEVNLKTGLNLKKNLSLAYTPGVAQVSRELYKNKNHAYDYTIKANTVAVVSDGSRVLGLKEQGPFVALPVMEGKCAIFKEFANIDAFPICLDTFDQEEIIKTVKYIAPVFGGINLEDICAPKCFAIETRLQKELDIPVFHDDQHGTAIVILAGLLNALKIVRKRLSQIKITMLGAGSSGIAVAKFLLFAGAKNLILVDRAGALYAGRKQDMNSAKREIARLTNKNKLIGSLEKTLEKSDVVIGLSRAGVLTPSMLKLMNPEPIVFALSNPEPEIRPSLAKKAGACIIATGRSDFPNQLNNALAFPGIFRGALDAQLKNITREHQLRASRALASLIKNPTPSCIIPTIFDKRVVPAVAGAMKR